MFDYANRCFHLCVAELNVLRLLFGFSVYRNLSQSADQRCLCQEALVQ